MSLDQETKDALLFLAQHKDDVVFLGDKSLLLALYGPYGEAGTTATEKNRIKNRAGRLFRSFKQPLAGEPTNVVQRLNKTLSLPEGGMVSDEAAATFGEGHSAPEDDGEDE